jgi:hypothetical protein
MYAQSSFSDFGDPLTLTPDDQNAICLAYPTARAVGACTFEPEKGFSPVCGGDIHGGCAIAGAPSPRRIPLAALTLFAALGAFWVRLRGTRRAAC